MTITLLAFIQFYLKIRVHKLFHFFYISFYYNTTILSVVLTCFISLFNLFISFICMIASVSIPNDTYWFLNHPLVNCPEALLVRTVQNLKMMRETEMPYAE